jgi:hypothetical protein
MPPGFAGRTSPFDFALSKIPTSRAKNAREMGHPAPGIFISFGGPQPMGTHGGLGGLSPHKSKYKRPL